MAKKQNRSQKNVAASQPKRPSDSSQKPHVSDSSFLQPLNSYQFGCTIAFLLVATIYFVGFLFVKTEFGDRFGAYLALGLNPDLFGSFWTGSPSAQMGVFDRLPVFIGFAFHMLLAWGIGKFVGRRMALKLKYDLLEVLVLELALGLTTISTYTLLVGLAQLYSLKIWVVLPLCVLAALGFWQSRPFGMQKDQEPGPPIPSGELESSHWTHWGWALSIPFCLFILLGSSLPPWEFDVREYHLQVPKEWYQSGGVSYLSHNVYGNMPLGTEMHALAAMLYSFGDNDWWWGALIGKTVSGCFAILNCLLIYSLGLRIFGRFAGVCGSLLYISTPWITANSIVGYNESALAFYLLASILVLVVHLQSDDTLSKSTRSDTTESDHRVWIMLGVLGGSAAAVKYTAVPFVVFPLFVLTVYWLLKTGHIRQAITPVLLLFLGLFLTFGPWLVKNAVWTGNPTYPLGASVFGSPQSDAQVEQWKKAHSPKEMFPAAQEWGSKLTSLLIRYKWLSPLVIPFFVMGLLHESRRTLLYWLAYLSFVFAVWILFTHRLERFLLPFYPVVCLVAGAGTTWLKKANWQNLVLGILVFGSLLNGLFASSRLVGDVRILASMEQLDSRSLEAADYFHPDGLIVPLNHLSPEIAWLNEKHPDARVLFYGECRPFTARFEVIYNTCFDECETWELFSRDKAESIYRNLLEQKVTHILVNPSELERLKSTYGYNVNHLDSLIQPQNITALAGKYLRRVTPIDFSDSKQRPNVLLFEVIRQRD